MKVAYVDTSCLVAIAFGETGSATMVRRLRAADALFSSNLLEAELWAAFERERVDRDETLVASLSWVLPDRPLSSEIGRVPRTGHLRGADVWHLACALYLAGEPDRIAFLTLDTRQRKAASALGFDTG